MSRVRNTIHACAAKPAGTAWRLGLMLSAPRRFTPMRSTHGTHADSAVVGEAVRDYHAPMNLHRMFSRRAALNVHGRRPRSGKTGAEVRFSNRADESRSYSSENLDMCVGVAVGAREQVTP